jgi:hypothetical protein
VPAGVPEPSAQLSQLLGLFQLPVEPFHVQVTPAPVSSLMIEPTALVMPPSVALVGVPSAALNVSVDSTNTSLLTVTGKTTLAAPAGIVTLVLTAV